MPNTNVYMKQGGDEQVIASGGQQTIESGGKQVIESGGYVDDQAQIVTLTGTSLTLAPATHAQRTVVMSYTASPLAEVTVTLPAATGTGDKYRLVVGAVNTSNYKVQVANASDTIDGFATLLQDGGDTAVHFETAATSDTITFDGTTTGGAGIGDYIELQDIASNQWICNVKAVATGTEATPFSAAVS
jgi:hypothetical protein